MLLRVLLLCELLSAAHAFQLGSRGLQSQQMRRVTTVQASIEAPPPPGTCTSARGRTRESLDAARPATSA